MIIQASVFGIMLLVNVHTYFRGETDFSSRLTCRGPSMTNEEYL